MHALRQYFWVLFIPLIASCSGSPFDSFDPMALIYNESSFSQDAQTKGNIQCGKLYGINTFNRLKGKIPVMPGDLPTRAMMGLNTVPTGEEINAIQALESASRNCQKLRASAGVPTSATEDILAARLSKLRYGLYKGQIPFAVYNYGVVQAMRKANNFMMEGEKSAQKGHEVGQGRLKQYNAMMGMGMLGANLAQYDNTLMNRVWQCDNSGYCY